MKTEINGVDLLQMNEIVEMIKESPKLARFSFKASSKWIDGGKSKVEIQKFFGAGHEDDTRLEPFVIETDEPAVLLGTNKSPNPVEYILASLVSCLTVGYAYTAAAWGIELDSLEFEIEGGLNLCGFLGIEDTVRPGYEEIKIKTIIKADATDERLEKLNDYVQRTSPVLDIIRNPVQVTFTDGRK